MHNARLTTFRATTSLAAAVFLIVSACGDSDGTESDASPPLNSDPKVTQPVATDNSTVNSDTPSSLATTAQPVTTTDPEPTEDNRIGATIGTGIAGPAPEAPRVWPIDTIYTDADPEQIVVEFTPPNPECISANASATIGRGGAVLVELFVDDATLGTTCDDGATSNQVIVELVEPLNDRRTYTSVVADFPEAAEAENLADEIIGLPLDEARTLVDSAALTWRDLTDSEAAEDDLNPERINVWTDEGRVVFADVG